MQRASGGRLRRFRIPYADERAPVLWIESVSLFREPGPYIMSPPGLETGHLPPPSWRDGQLLIRGLMGGLYARR